MSVVMGALISISPEIPCVLERMCLTVEGEGNFGNYKKYTVKYLF